ncbi:hypothetical protein [Labilibacter marinus]|uniref:hypothetical protein n=1 Tax=Labilibacter marinus TaxID=1477105 RepID=UPI00082EDBDF|nr:hypothetical protein [Labilibacter marinus]
MKSILLMALVICLGTTALVANSTTEMVQAKVELTEDLTFAEIAIAKIPKVVSEAFFKEHEGAAIASAHKATTSAGVVVFKISVKDAEGISEYLYKGDGTVYKK